MTQQTTIVEGREKDPVGGHIDLRYGSNAVRLTAARWLLAAAIIAAAVLAAPPLWEKVEPLAAGPDYRIPYRLSSDYWLYGRYARLAAAEEKTLVVGDSVVWGQYVPPGGTLSHFLNQETGRDRFANLGLDGAHPVALAGLVEFYGGAIAGRNVVLHCNLLWTATKKHDLQERQEFRFNHPTLVPQFVPEIPCYSEVLSRRIGITINRHLTFPAWADHLRLAYLDQSDLAAWTLEHPHSSPAEALWPRANAAEDRPQHDAAPWTERGIRPQAYEWVDLDTSLQWRYFRRTVEVLRERGNRVFVVVGPFNEHLLEPASLATYTQRKQQVAAWLRENNIASLVPDALPSPLYADASHPLAEGYARLAKQLIGDPSFGAWASSDAAGK